MTPIVALLTATTLVTPIGALLTAITAMTPILAVLLVFSGTPEPQPTAMSLVQATQPLTPRGWMPSKATHPLTPNNPLPLIQLRREMAIGMAPLVQPEPLLRDYVPPFPPRSQLRPALVAAEQRARQLFRDTNCPQDVAEWVTHWVNRGPDKDLPDIREDHIGQAFIMLASPQVREWQRLENIYTWEKQRK